MFEVSLGVLPFPYKAMLAICSDLDETPDFDTYLEIVKFLNTSENTRYGRGIGLEVGNSIYFDMPKSQFAYWNADEKGRHIIRLLIQSGYIDCLHSYGDLASSRRHAETVLDELIKYNCKLSVWVDHAQAPTNFGPDIMMGRGDIPGDEAYHADLTISYGIKFVWLGRVTSVVGQNVPRKLSGIWTPRHPVASFKTLLKEVAKGLLGRQGNGKYAMHHQNNLMRNYKLRNGQEVIEFMRSTFHWGGISYDDTAEGLNDVLTNEKLDLLVKRGGVSIIYTHLGKLKGSRKFPDKTVAALKRLKRYYEDKKILVTTTSRLLKYFDMLESLEWTVISNDNELTIEVQTDKDIADLQGLSFCIPKDKAVHLKINDKLMDDIIAIETNSSGHSYIYIPWQKLEFPSV